MTVPTTSEYRYRDATHAGSHGYLWPSVKRISLGIQAAGGSRAFDLGCGNGSITSRLAALGFEATGIDASESGVAVAKNAFPHCRFELASAYDDLASRFGIFPLVVSLEVVEHVFDPRAYARTVRALLQPGGTAVISTPYHGYLKNCALALSGKLDQHFTALWDGGHIKFWSIKTLGTLLEEAGLTDIRFERVGRFPALAKSMIAIARRP